MTPQLKFEQSVTPLTAGGRYRWIVCALHGRLQRLVCDLRLRLSGGLRAESSLRA